jgi:hypothetical protein
VSSPPFGSTPGYLQLTDALFNRVGAILYNHALPARGGIDATFEAYQYGGGGYTSGGHTFPPGADGIGFFLVNGAVDLTTAGANGGSLGYAQRTVGTTNMPGVHGGVLGVGLHVFGSYANDAESRGNGCATRQPGVGQGGSVPSLLKPNVVGLRGPGEEYDVEISARVGFVLGHHTTAGGALPRRGAFPLLPQRIRLLPVGLGVTREPSMVYGAKSQ